MVNRFHIQKVFSEAFGYEPPSFKIEQAPDRLESSSLGQPYFSEDAVGREFFLPATLEGILIPFAVISIVTKKTLVETPLPERGGSVTEMISIDDFAINIKGILITED